MIFRYLLAVVAIIAGTFTAGMYMGFKGLFTSEQKVRVEFGYEQGPHPVTSLAPPAQETKESADSRNDPPSPLPEAVEVAPRAPNATDRWISEFTGIPYFIQEIGDEVRIFENDARRQRVQTGSGVRNGDEIIAQYYSRLGGTNGVLKLRLSSDGKSLVGRFTPLDNRSEEGPIRLLRSSS